MSKQGALARIVVGENIGTLIQSGD
jgi:hypothetical protein